MFHVSQDDRLRAAEQYARELFFENPSLSIDVAAREIERHCKRSLIKPVISTIRMEVRQRIGDAQQPKPPPQRFKGRYGPPAEQLPLYPPVRLVEASPPPPEPFNPPRLAVQPEPPPSNPPEEKEIPVPSATPDTNDDDLRPSFETSTKVERSAYLSEWFTAHPNATIAEGRLALQEKFGCAIATQDIVETKRLVRDILAADAAKAETDSKEQARKNAVQAEAKAGWPPPAEAPAQHPIKDIVARMRAAGIRKIQISDDNSYSVEGAL